jgi:hypothetical protein
LGFCAEFKVLAVLLTVLADPQLRIPLLTHHTFEHCSARIAVELLLAFLNEGLTTAACWATIALLANCQ